MKVLFLTSMYYKPRGTDAGLAIHRQATELLRAGIDLRVICPVARFNRAMDLLPLRSRTFGTRSLEVDGVPVTYLPFPNLPLRFSAGGHVALLSRALKGPIERLRRNFPFDLIHVHRLFPTGYAALEIARHHGVPLVSSAVGSDVHTYPTRSRGIRRRVIATIQGSSTVIAVSKALAAEVCELTAPPVPPRIVYRGVDTTRFSPSPSMVELRKRFGLPVDGLGISTVSRLVREKGILELLAAVEQMAVNLPNVWISLIGNGPLEGEIASRIRSPHLKGRVFLAGSRPHDEVASWINASDLFVLASYREGLPNVVREAMACGRPVVATDVGGVSEVLEDGVTGLLVPAREVAPLRTAIERLLRDSELRMSMGTAGRELVESRFTWDRSTTALLEVYEEVMRERMIPPPAVSGGVAVGDPAQTAVAERIDRDYLGGGGRDVDA